MQVREHLRLCEINEPEIRIKMSDAYPPRLKPGSRNDAGRVPKFGVAVDDCL